MYQRSFLCEEAKIKQRTPLKKELCEIGEEAIWESRFTSCFLLFTSHLFCDFFFNCDFLKNKEHRGSPLIDACTRIHIFLRIQKLNHSLEI